MRYILAILFSFAAFAQRTPRVVDSTAALVALTPSATAPDVIVVATNANTRIQFRYYPTASDATNAASPYVYATSTGTGRWKEVRLTGDLTGVTVDGASIDPTAKINITNGTAVNLTGTVNDITINGTSIYNGDDRAVISAGTSFNYSLRGTSAGTITMGPLAHTTTSIATLQAVSTDTMTTNATIEVRGYYTAGDGGGGTFYYAPFEATNRGMVFQAGNASFVWVRSPGNGPISAKWFGAKGDGVTDDTAALDAARDWTANAARTSGVSTVLYLPRGNYLHSGNFTVSGQIKLKGDGLETSGAGNGTTIVCTGDNTPAVAVSGQGFGIEDIEIRYQTFQDSTKTNSVTLKFAGDTYKYSIRNVAVRAGYDSIAAAQSINVYNGTVDNLFVRSYSHSGVRMLSGGTVNTWNNLYVQNLANVQVTQTAAITNVALANGTNITLTCSGSLPSLLATNRQFVVTGLDSGYNGNFFLRAISGSVVYCDAASTLSAPSDITGTLTFFAQPATGYPIELGNGEHTFIGLDVEHVVTDAAAIIYAPSLSYVHIVDAHLEAVYRSSGGLFLVHSPNGSVTVDSLSVINSGFNVGSANYTFRNESTMSSLIGGNVTARDIAFTGATWHTGSAGTGADHPMVASVKAATTYRANATGTPTGDGSLRYILGGGNKATGSSGTDNIFNFQPTVTESGTARYFGWMINPTATTLGSGISYPLWVGENSTNYYRVSNRGSHVTEAETAQSARFIRRSDTGDEVALSYGSATDRKITIAGNSIDVVVKSTSGAAGLSLQPTGGAVITGGVIELGNASDTTLARSAAGVVTIEGVTIAERPTTTALTYSGTNVTLTATSHVLHGNTLTLTNNCLLTITSSDGASGGITIVPHASTSYTVYLASAIKLLGGTTSFVVTNSASETVNLEWKQTKRGASDLIIANKAVYP